MSLVNHLTKEIHCKIVYYGPGLGGKTSNIQYIYKATGSDLKSKLMTLSTENERTMFFDFLPLELGEVRGHKTKFHLYTVPGQSFYEASRRLILRGVDGIVFVVDSQVERMQENVESFKDLEKNLKMQGMDLKRIPLVIQWNKRDLPNVADISDIRSQLPVKGRKEIEAVASSGAGVLETLKLIGKEILINLKRGVVRTEVQQ